jgi:hypothetical protein
MQLGMAEKKLMTGKKCHLQQRRKYKCRRKRSGWHGECNSYRMSEQ